MATIKIENPIHKHAVNTIGKSFMIIKLYIRFKKKP